MKDYHNTLANNQSIDTIVILDGINRDEAIYEPIVAILKFKNSSKNTTTCTEHDTHPTTQTTTIPPRKWIDRSIFHVCKRPHIMFHYIVQYQFHINYEYARTWINQSSKRSKDRYISVYNMINQYWDGSLKQLLWGSTRIINTSTRQNSKLRWTRGTCVEAHEYI